MEAFNRWLTDNLHLGAPAALSRNLPRNCRGDNPMIRHGNGSDQNPQPDTVRLPSARVESSTEKTVQAQGVSS